MTVRTLITNRDGDSVLIYAGAVEVIRAVHFARHGQHAESSVEEMERILNHDCGFEFHQTPD